MSIDALFSQATRLPSIPKLVQELIESFDNPNANLNNIAAKIALEPVLTAKVLRVANSAHFGLPRQVASVQDAVIIMGFPAVRTLVMASGMIDSLQIPPALNKKEFWLNVFEVAGCAKWLCRFKKDLDANAAYTAGILHSLGQLLMYAVEPKLADAVNQKVAAGIGRYEAELDIFGYSHCEVGAELTKRWKFPDTLNTSVKYQNDPKAATPASVLASIIYLAKRIVKLQKGGMTAEDLLDNLPESIRQNPPIDLQAMLQSLVDKPDFTGGMANLLEA